MRVLHIISGNDNGGGGNHVINICLNGNETMNFTLGLIGKGPLLSKAKESKINLACFTYKSFINGEVVSFIKENNIEIVDFHGAKAFLLNKLIKRKTNAISVATVHSNYRQDFLNNKLKHVFYTPLSIMGLHSFNNFICTSNYIKGLLDNDNFKGHKYLVNNGINLNKKNIKLNKKSIRESLGILQDDFIYAIVARMHPVKNHIMLIHAFAKLIKEESNVKLLLIGDGPLEEKLKKEASLLNIKKDIYFLGFKENALDYVNCSNISILCSLSEGGAPPLAVLESASVKTTVIASKIGDMEEILNDNRGFLIDPYSEDDIYSKLKEAYLRRDELQNMGENLYWYIYENYSMSKFSENYYSAYSDILKNGDR